MGRSKSHRGFSNKQTLEHYKQNNALHMTSNTCCGGVGYDTAAKQGMRAISCSTRKAASYYLRQWCSDQLRGLGESPGSAMVVEHNLAAVVVGLAGSAAAVAASWQPRTPQLAGLQ